MWEKWGRVREVGSAERGGKREKREERGEDIVSLCRRMFCLHSGHLMRVSFRSELSEYSSNLGSSAERAR